MSRRSAGLLSLFAFGLGILSILSTGGIRTAQGQPKPLVVNPAPQAPTLASPVTLGMKRGGSAELVLSGTNLSDPVAVLLSCPGKAAIVPDSKGAKADSTKVKVKVEVPADAPIGFHTIRVATTHGVSNFRPFLVDDLPSVDEVATNRTKETAQAVPSSCVVNGHTDTEASDFFKVKVAAGQTLTFEVLARRIGSPLDPIVVLHDAKTRRELLDQYADDTPGLESDCRLTHGFKEAGEVLVEVRDTTYRGGAGYDYRLRIGDFPGAMTAYPLAVRRGTTTTVAFAGQGAAGILPVAVRAPADPAIAALTVSPMRAAGASGWPLPVRLSDDPQSVEQEPNNTPAKATKLPVPGGVSARFLEKGDLDHFAIAGKKGEKLVVSVWTYEVNSPAEVLVRILDGKEKEIARSSPTAVPTRVEFTPPADGPYTIACEHLNYLFGPNEIYHVAVHATAPDFDVSLPLDRCEAPAGGGTSLIVANVARLGGYAGAVELSVAGNPALSGTVVVPAGQTQTALPVLVKAGTKLGAYPFRVKATATINGKPVVRYATLLDYVKTNLGGMPNPPLDLLNGCMAAVIEKPPFSIAFTPEPKAFEKGKAAKLIATAKRDKGVDGDIVLAPLFTPPNIAVAAKPIPKGKTAGEATVTPAAAAAVGATSVVVRATTKVGGKDYAVTPPPTAIEVIAAKKVEPKKEPPKKKKK